jgi:hypothetical protein
MQTVDFGAYIVAYNFVIGVLVMLSSEKIGVYAGSLNKAHQAGLTRLTRLSTFTLGACVTILSGTVYIAFHTLKLGL